MNLGSAEFQSLSHARERPTGSARGLTVAEQQDERTGKKRRRGGGGRRGLNSLFVRNVTIVFTP